MEELLTQLTKKARLECEESHRQFVAAMNGLAALDIVDEQVFPDVFSFLTSLAAFHTGLLVPGNEIPQIPLVCRLRGQIPRSTDVRGTAQGSVEDR